MSTAKPRAALQPAALRAPLSQRRPARPRPQNPVRTMTRRSAPAAATPSVRAHARRLARRLWCDRQPQPAGTRPASLISALKSLQPSAVHGAIYTFHARRSLDYTFMRAEPAVNAASHPAARVQRAGRTTASPTAPAAAAPSARRAGASTFATTPAGAKRSGRACVLSAARATRAGHQRHLLNTRWLHGHVALSCCNPQQCSARPCIR